MKRRWIETLFSSTEIFVESPWAGLIPVMNLLIDICRPESFVELGTYRGCSFFAALSAAKACNYEMQATAIDTWQGDLHSGFYDGDQFLREVEAGIAAIGMPATLLRQSFDEAVAQFADGSVDLLHIDGYHTYEASLGDFNTWRSKLSPRGVVMFHDITVRTGSFGVWRTWEELSAKYPHVDFSHSNGLGVLFVGPNISTEVAALLDQWNSEPHFAETFRTLAEIAGRNYSNGCAIEATGDAHAAPSSLNLKVLHAELQELRGERQCNACRMTELEGTLKELRDVNMGIRASTMWPLIHLARPLRKRFKRICKLTQQALEITVPTRQHPGETATESQYIA